MIAQEQIPPAVVLGAGINGLNIIRSLGKRGIPIIDATVPSSDYSLKSRYIKKVYFESLIGPDLVKALLHLRKSLDNKAVLFCTSDLDVVTVSRHRRELQQWYHIILPPHNVVETLMNKKLFYDFALRNNFLVPKTYFTNTANEAEEISRIISYPCIIKPQYHDEYWSLNLLSVYGIKVLYAQNRDEYVNHFKRFKIETRPLIIQEWIDGGDTDVFFCLTYISRYYQPLAIFTGKKIRQYPPLTGSTSLAESVWNPTVADNTLKVLTKARCFGICSVEFKRCPRTDKFYITEPTVGRVDTQEGISISAGMDIPYLCYLDAIGQTPAPMVHFEEGIKWINEPYDIYSIKEYLTNGQSSLKDLLSKYKGKRSYSLWSLDDIRPSLIFFLSIFKKLLQKAIPYIKNRNKSKDKPEI